MLGKIDSLTPSFLIDWLVLDLFNTAVEREKERDLFFLVSFLLREDNQGKMFLFKQFFGAFVKNIYKSFQNVWERRKCEFLEACRDIPSVGS